MPLRDIVFNMLLLGW